MKKHAHCWNLDSENYGVCKRCGAEKQFHQEPFPKISDMERSKVESFKTIGGDTVKLPEGFHLFEPEM